MKSLTAVCQTGAPAINASGRISRHAHQRGDGENAEMKMYLSKLKDLVPFMPKNRKLSKLEIIQHVIDYICDLQTELETHPEVNNFDAASALNNYAAAVSAQNANIAALDSDMLSERLAAEQLQQQQQQHSSPATPTRQPLVDRQTPNTILPANVNASPATTTTPTASQQQTPAAASTSPAAAAASTSALLQSATLAEKESHSRRLPPSPSKSC